jgi:hypothetical protein
MLFVVVTAVGVEEQVADATAGFSWCTRSLGGGKPKS